MADLFSNVTEIQWQMVVMWVIGGLLIWLAIKKEMEPTLLLPMGFGAILVNLPWSGAVDQAYPTGVEHGLSLIHIYINQPQTFFQSARRRSFSFLLRHILSSPSKQME